MNRPFKQPRLNKPIDIVNPESRKEMTVLSERESPEGTQLQTTRHRKDNSAWGKRMEKELAAIERRAACTESKAVEKRDEHSEVLPQAESGED